MKKLYYLIVLVLILGLVLTGCSLLSNVGQVPTTEQSGITYLTKHTAGDPFTTDLMADGGDPALAIDVGDVLVWNDGDYLYVKYVLPEEGDWRLTETHLHVFLDDVGYADVPQKKGNPIPGKFEYKGKHAYETVVLYEISLDWDLGTQLFIAAHAKVIRPIEDYYEAVWQIGDVEVNDCAGNLTNYANEFNWKKLDLSGGYTLPVGDCEQGPGLNADEPLFTTPFIVGITPTDEFPYNSNFSKPYAADFDVQWNGSLPFGGLLTVSWSPGASATEKKVVSDDGITSTTFTAYGVNTPGEGWFMDKYPLVEHSVDVDPLSDGLHTINFQHTKGDGTFWDWIRLEKPCEKEETAWASDGEVPGSIAFPGKNWATYFKYTLQEYLVEIIKLDAEREELYGDGICSKESLISNKNYRIDVSGTYYYRNPINDFGLDSIADAEWAQRPVGDPYNLTGPVPIWIKGEGTYSNNNGLDLMIDGINIDWGDLSSNHEYSIIYTGKNAPICFKIFDSFADNSGLLTVKIYWKP